MSEDKLTGTIERITFHNPENGFAVLKVQARGRRNMVTVVGNITSPVVGEYMEAIGSWVRDPTFGEQLRATELRTTPPHTLEGIEKYLGSGLVKGIGPHFAKKIVAHFGERTLEVIDESPAHLKEIKGIGATRIQRIRESWSEQKSVRNIMVFLQSHGIGTARAVRIYKTYGDQAVELVRENPYRLASDIWGFGFQTADALALRLGMHRHSPLRARAALKHTLNECALKGNVGYPEALTIQETAEKADIPVAIVAAAVEEERKGGEIVREPNLEEPWLYLKPLFLAELGVARAIHGLQTGVHPLHSIDTDAALAWVEKRMNLELADSQREALRQATTEKVLIVTGGPGVGKTTIVQGILDIFTARNLRCALCAPTGRAAKRLSETTGRDAKTIHRLLEFEPALGAFKKDRENTLKYDLIVVDEASMVDVVLMNQLLRAVAPHTCLVLVGDVDQLPSVGPGRVLKELIDSDMVSTVRLNQIFRQAGESWIVRGAHQINDGQVPDSAPPNEGDFYFIEVDEPPIILERIETLVRDRIPSRFNLDPFGDIQILCPMNNAELGVLNVNQRLQEVLNPSKGGAEVERFGSRFRVGDKVIQTQNNYQKEIFNGDIGRVESIDGQEREVHVAFEEKTVSYDFGELDEISLAYAISIHKSQGSEYPAIVIPLHTQHYMMLQRNLLYTGITRGKQLVVLVGSRKALEIAVKRMDTERRCSALAWRLQNEHEQKSQPNPDVPDDQLFGW